MNARQANETLRPIRHTPRGNAPAGMRSYLYEPAHADRTEALHRTALLALVAWADMRATTQRVSETMLAADRVRIETWHEQGTMIRANIVLSYGSIRERAMLFLLDTGKGANLQIDVVHPTRGNMREVLMLTEAARGADGLWRFDTLPAKAVAR